MTHVLNLNGILVSSFVGQALLALIILLLLRPLLGWFRFQKPVWNPPLVECALGICILGLIILLS